MIMNENKLKKQVGRKPKNSPAVFRYSISLNAEDNARFLSLFEQSEMKVKAHFITACIFQKTIKTVKIDMSSVDFYTRLTNFYSQFRSVGVNYNQIVKIIYRNFSEKKAAAYLFKLEKQTAVFAQLCREIIDLTKKFETKYLDKSQEK
jgi:hypothetical protein